jgi:hypothetical protein
LLGQNKFTAREVFSGFRKQDCDLQGKSEIAIKVLMEAVVVAWAIFE